jgi:hypothetical protein
MLEWAYSRKGAGNIKADVMALHWEGTDRIRLIEHTNNCELQSMWPPTLGFHNVRGSLTEIQEDS